MITFRVECARTWESLRGASDVRWCDGCARDVFACATAEEARSRGQRGECVAVPSVLVASRRPPTAPPRTKTVGMLGGDDGLPSVMWLVPLDGARAGETLRLELSRDGHTLGCESPADLVIPDAEVAPLHARIACTEQGATIIDAGTPAGTSVNGRRIAKFDLVDNDIIQVGTTRLQFKSTT